MFTKQIYLVAFSLLLVLSCTDNQINENTPTTKNESTTLSKNTTTQLDFSKETKLKPPQFGHVIDTVHGDGTKAFPCGLMYIDGWAITKYSPKSGKLIGIMANNSPITWDQYYNKYGFTSLVVSNTTSYNTAKNIGFSDNNLMVNITNYSTAYTQINSMSQAKYFLVDEPFEREMYTISTLRAVASMVHEANTDSKMMMVSYKWPSFPCNFPWSGTYGGNYKSVLDWASNAYIMCDEYPGNYYGHTDEYWSKYSSYYGSQKHIADWFHLNINSAYTGSGSSFYVLFNKANTLGISKLWLFAGSSTSPTTTKLEQFCHSAFNSEWLRGFAQNYRLVYRCYEPDPCNNCSEDDYYLDEIIWYSNLYEVYP